MYASIHLSIYPSLEPFSNLYVSICSFSFLSLFLFFLGLFSFWFFWFLGFSFDSSISSFNFLEDFLESIELINGGESSAELFQNRLIVREIVATPNPRFIVGFECNKLAKRILRRHIEISNNLVGFVLSHQDTHSLGFLVLQELQITSTSFLELGVSPSVELSSEFIEDFFVFFTSDDTHLRKFLYWLEITTAFSFRVVVLVDLLFVFSCVSHDDDLVSFVLLLLIYFFIFSLIYLWFSTAALVFKYSSRYAQN